MALFGKVENDIVNIFIKLSANQDFLKLISNDTPDALSESPSMTFGDLINVRLTLYPKIFIPESEQGSFVNIYMQKVSKLGQNNTYQYDMFYIVDVMSHLDIWTLTDNKVRPYRLVDNIHDDLEDTNINGIRGKLTFQKCDYMVYSKNFTGYRLIYKLTRTNKC